MTAETPVYLELGKKRVFACALDWPGWCRSGKTEDEAIARLAEYAPRYAVVAAEAALALSPDVAEALVVVERVPGSATTDFGAPGVPAPSDSEPWSASEARRHAGLVDASWRVLGDVVKRAPAELAKGPRGGGRNRDKVLQHVLGAETAYARQLGVRQREPKAEDGVAVAALREAVRDALLESHAVASIPAAGWPPRYAGRRIAWHVLDHAWEIEDRGGLTPGRRW